MPEIKSPPHKTSASGVPLTADHQQESAPITPKQCRKFLSELAVSGDIVAAAAAAGRDEADFFAHRQANVGFRAEWDAAFDIAYMRMESACVAVVIRAVTRPASETEPRLLAIYHRLALSLMAARRAMKRVPQKAAPPTPRTGSIHDAETLIAKLHQMRQRKEQSLADLAQNG
jgi:hypothetical protein